MENNETAPERANTALSPQAIKCWIGISTSVMILLGSAGGSLIEEEFFKSSDDKANLYGGLLGAAAVAIPAGTAIAWSMWHRQQREYNPVPGAADPEPGVAP